MSFGGRQLDPIVRYVLNQRRHHHDGTVIPLLERDHDDRPPTPSLQPKPTAHTP